MLALASAGSTTKAGALLHLTQPAVSRALLLAEEKLGARLFERTARGLEATPAGERLISGAGPLLVELADLEARVLSPLARPERIRLVCECYTAYRWLPSVLADLERVLPGLEVKLVPEHSRDPLGALSSNEVDVALITTALVKKPLEEKSLFHDEIVFVVGRTHPLAKKIAITPRDLRENVLITSSSTSQTENREFVRQVFGQRKPKLDLMRLPLTEAIIDMARAGMGVAVLSEWIAASYLGESSDLVAKRLATGPLRRPWRIAYRHEAKTAALRLRSALEASVPHARLHRAS